MRQSAAAKRFRQSIRLLPMLLVPMLLPALAFAADDNAEVCPGTGLAARIVPCIRDKIMAVAYQFFDQVYPKVEYAIDFALLLAVIFFGVMLSIGGVRRVTKSTFVLLIKYGAAIYFTANLSVIFDWAVDIMNGLIDIVSNFHVQGQQLRCPVGGDIWSRVDCVLDSLIGINGSGAGLSQLARGMLSFLYGSLTSGAIGVGIFIIGVYMCFNICMGLFRACITYLLGLMMLSLVILAGIIFLPLMAFKASGMQYFSTWTRMIGACILQPVIVFAFLNIVLVALDITMFSGQNSVFRTIAGDAVDGGDFSLNKYMEENNLYVRNKFVPALADITPRATLQVPVGAGPDQGTQGGNNGINNQPVNPTDPGSIRVGIEYRAIDFAEAARVRKGGPALPAGDQKQGMMWAMASAMLLAGLVSYLLMQLMAYMPRIAQDIGGGIKESPDIGSGWLPGEQIVSRGIGNVTKQAEDLVARRPR